MKNNINGLIALSAMIFIALACNASFTTAGISSFNIGKDEKANPPITSFNVGEKVYAVANVSGAMGKHKMKFKVTPPTGSNTTPLEKDIDFEGSRPVYLFFNAPAPGEYKVEAVLVDEQGKEVDKKSNTFSVKGNAPASTTTDKSNSDANDADDEDKEDKPAEK